MTKQVYENHKSKKWEFALKSLLISMILSLTFTAVSFGEGGGRYAVHPWSFGVHGDTQWTVEGNPEDNPDHVAVAMINALDEQFINAGVKFVIQVGDLSDRAGNAAMYTRAAAAQPLYDKGIGFFPLRGNHETYGYLFGNDPEYDLNIPAYLDAFPQTQGMANTFGATNFSSPDIDVLKGLSYSFDYGNPGNNARFLIVDTEQTAVNHQAAPDNPESCVTAITPGTPEGTTPFCGQGYFYVLSDLGNYNTGFTVFKATYDITNGVTTTYDSAGNTVESDISITITAGTWFRIDSDDRPSTNFYAWDMENPDQTYNGNPFDLYDPIENSNNRLSEINSSAGTEIYPGSQQDWISARLDKTARGTEHAFVFSHRGLMGENHVDCLFGSNPGSKADTQNVFYASLMNNGVKYMISGHDHLYNRALVDSPDENSQVEQIISQGASSKFYTPNPLSSFLGTKFREIEISQEIKNFGYYIYTVDGPRVTVDYYSDAFGNFVDENGYPDGSGSLELPVLNFVRQETWGYSQNGKQFLIAQGESYAGIEDTFGKTTAKILAGDNESVSTDYTPGDVEFDENGIQISGPRALDKTVNTGWVAKPEADFSKKGKDHNKFGSRNELKSDILSLWGMSELGANEVTDTYVLSLSFDFRIMDHLGKGDIGIATYVDGKWVNAVDENFGEAKKKFVVGKYKPKYGLGTYGIDPATKTAWAVLNYNADFAVANNIVPPARVNAKSMILNKFRLFSPGFFYK